MTYEQLRSTTTEELIRRHDDIARGVTPNLAEVRQELVHRDTLHAAQVQWGSPS